MLLTNPMTASVLLETAIRGGHRAFAQTAAAGALGRMLSRLCRRRGLPMVDVVRRPEQAEALRADGAEHVVVSTAPGAGAEMRATCARLAVRLAFDAIGGEATRQLAHALPDGGRVVVYGLLSGEPCVVDTADLVFRDTHIEGFTMYRWLADTSMLGQLRVLRGAQKRLVDDLRSEVRATRALAEHGEAIALARAQASEGKVLFVHRDGPAR